MIFCTIFIHYFEKKYPGPEDRGRFIEIGEAQIEVNISPSSSVSVTEWAPISARTDP